MRRKINKIAVALFAVIMGSFFLTGCVPQASDSENSASTESNISASTESGSASYNDENSSDSTESGSSSETLEDPVPVKTGFEKDLKEYYEKPNYGNPTEEQWEGEDKSEYIVTYMLDEEVYHKEKVNKNLSVTLPAPPEKEGEIFIGWYKEKYGDKSILSGANYIGKEDCTLKAKFLSRIESNDGEGLTFTLNLGGMGYSVTDFNDEYTVVNIPETYNGLPVTEIAGHAFEGCQNLAEVKIPGNIKKIKTSAFNSCYFLAKVELCEGIREIETIAFAVCRALREIYLPDSLTDLGADSTQPGCYCVHEIFGGCGSLMRVSVPGTVNSFYAAHVVYAKYVYFRGTREQMEKKLKSEPIFPWESFLSKCYFIDDEE